MHLPLLLHGQTLTVIDMLKMADALQASVALKKNRVVFSVVTFQNKMLFCTSASAGLPSIIDTVTGIPSGSVASISSSRLSPCIT